MEQCEQSLLDMIDIRLEENLGPFPAEHITKVAIDIAKALEYLHNALILHGDIKSGNVLVKSKLNNYKIIKNLFYFIIQIVFIC